MNYKNYIAVIEDFPIKGISFKDITPLLQDGEAFASIIDDLTEFVKSTGANVVVGPESRGFIFGCPIATKLKIGFVPIRKPGKLPRKEVVQEYICEYNTNKLCMHADAVKPGDKVVIVDDLLATGGTVDAAIKLIEKCGATVVGCAFAIELTDLKGRENFKNVPVKSIMTYNH